MKQALHYHSDCFGFFGCENMVANFLNDAGLAERFQVTFSYRSNPDYDRGLRARVRNLSGTSGLRLLDPAGRIRHIDQRWIRRSAWLLAELALWKYACLAWNVAVLYRFFRRRCVAILHINNGGYPAANSCRAAAIAGRLAGIRHIVLVVNNQAEPYASPTRWLDYPIDRWVRRSVTVFVTGSHVAAERLRAVLGTEAAKHRVIPNGIARRQLCETPESVLHRLGISATRPTVGVVARLETRKGHIVLLRALALGKAGGLFPQVPVLIIEGEGGELEALRKFVACADLDQDVRFCGREEHVFDLLNAVSIVVLPSISHEDMPNVVIEAMSLGKPVIGTRVGGIPEQIQHLESGLLVEPSDAEGLAQALRQLITEHGFRERLGSNARARFESNFTVDASVLAYQKLYQSMLAT